LAINDSDIINVFEVPSVTLAIVTTAGVLRLPL